MLETVTAPVFSAVLSGTLLTLQTVMMLTVGAHRNRARKGVGIDGDQTLERLVRRHGNLAENAAIFLIVLALYELLFGATTIVLMTGIVFFVARLLHILGFTNDAGSHLVNAKGAGGAFILMRVLGAGLTALATIVLGVGLVVSVWMTY